MRRTVTLLLLVLAIASPLVAPLTARQDGAPREAAPGPTTRYSRLYVFGDSYSDIGAGYIDGNACAGRAIFDRDPTPLGDPATYFFYHEGHPSTAVHRVVGRKLFEEIAARSPSAR
jgi:phospholipase/lecithinase/hemolysin